MKADTTDKKPQSNCRVHGFVFDVVKGGVRNGTTRYRCGICRRITDARHSKTKKRREYLRRYRENNKEYFISENRKNYLKNRRLKGRVKVSVEMKKEKELAYRKLSSQKLSDWYVRGLICKHSGIIKAQDVPYALVKLKRSQLKLKRKLKNENN